MSCLICAQLIAQTGTTVTPHYDPMIAKVIVHGETREVATARMTAVLGESKIVGPTNNMDYCRTILATEGEPESMRSPR
jgi:urea carboxylase